MLKMKIHDTVTESRHGEKNGKAWNMVNQINCFIEMKDGEVRRFPILLEANQSPYSAGSYEFDGEKLLTVGRFGLEVDRYRSLNLTPAKI
ncbi:hypothetical protein CCP3SC1AL1_1590014 [Gammaproteobacteria bacterium]